MTIQEAIKSGKPFGLPLKPGMAACTQTWYFLSPTGVILCETDRIISKLGVSFLAEQILREDWELKP